MDIFLTVSPPSIKMFSLNVLLKVWFHVELLATCVTNKFFILMHNHMGI